MAHFLDYDPLRGVTQLYDFDEQSCKEHIHYTQDVEPILDLTKIERNEGLSDARWRKKGMALYARIPPVIILKLKYEHGVDIFKRDHLAKAFQLINSEYPHLKTTNMTHTVKSHD